MDRSFPIYAPEELLRKVLFAVELIDPVTQALVSQGVKVIAEGLTSKPIVNRSGRFVWLKEGEARPTSIIVEPGTRPYEAVTASAPQLPDDLDKATEAQRLVRIYLKPTRAYEFIEGITAVRGTLLKTTGGTVAPIAKAEVQLKWFDDNSQRWIQAPNSTTTDKDGEFAVFVRLLPKPPAQPDIVDGFLRIHLRVTRNGETRKTPEDFGFLGQDREPKGRIPEGQVLRRHVTLAWDELQHV